MRWFPFFILFALVVSFVGNKIIYSEGERVGVLYKCSHKGLFWKTYECILIPNENYFINPEEKSFRFSLCKGFWNETLINKLKKNIGHKVIVKYKQKLTTFFGDSDTTYCLIDFEVVKNEALLK